MKVIFGTNFVAWAPTNCYKDGRYETELEVPNGFPFSPPKLLVKTFAEYNGADELLTLGTVDHPAITKDGFLCLSILKMGNGVIGEWSPAITLNNVLIA